jgi:hypothetical protein
MRLFSHWPVVRRLPAAGGHRFQIRSPSIRCRAHRSSESQNAGHGRARPFNNAIRLLFVTCALALPGCAIVDQYSGRATVYNLESEQTHDQGLLLNVVRASQRRPRQFSIVQQITGTATAEGSANLTFPFGPHNGLSASSGMFTATASGGPAFQVAPLETNEFYAGILQPASAQLIDLYVHGEFPHDLLFNLFIEKIVMRRAGSACLLSHLPQCEIVLQNYPGVKVQLELFQALVGYLINLGLSTEQVEAPPTKKPAKSKKKTGNSAGSDDDDDGGEADKPPPYRFCFAPRQIGYQALVKSASICGNQQAAIKSSASLLGRRSKFETVTISQRFADLLASIVTNNPPADPSNDETLPFRQIGGFAQQGVSLAIYTRSTESLIYYVGEVVRQQLYPDIEKKKRTVMVKTGPPFNHFDETPCSAFDQLPEACKPLFVLYENAPPNFATGSSVTYNGVQYSIPADQQAGSSYNTEAGSSYTVMTVMRQLLILNTKAKSLPTTSILTTR